MVMMRAMAMVRGADALRATRKGKKDMAYINVGARTAEGPVLTKKALRDILATRPETLEFYSTSQHGPRAGEQHITADPEDIGRDILQVCGPDPYRNRGWHASLLVAKRGGKDRVVMRP